MNSLINQIQIRLGQKFGPVAMMQYARVGGMEGGCIAGEVTKVHVDELDINRFFHIFRISLKFTVEPDSFPVFAHIGKDGRPVHFIVKESDFRVNTQIAVRHQIQIMERAVVKSRIAHQFH